VIHVLPLRKDTTRGSLVQRASAALFIAPAASSPRMPVDALALIYDLTPAESRIFEMIAGGSTPGGDCPRARHRAKHRQDPHAPSLPKNRLHAPSRASQARGKLVGAGVVR